MVDRRKFISTEYQNQDNSWRCHDLVVPEVKRVTVDLKLDVKLEAGDRDDQKEDQHALLKVRKLF